MPVRLLLVACMMQTPPICLVLGPFGSGKSTLLVAMLHFFLRERQQAGNPLDGMRCLVSAHTNVAVDRVLLGEGTGPWAAA